VAGAGEDQKCDWRRCAGCTECPIRLYECPSAADGPYVMPSGERVKITKAPSGKLCTLTQASSNISGQTISPVGRSYDQNDWERVAGAYTHLNYDCSENDCYVDIPAIDDEQSSTDAFQLTSFDSSERVVGSDRRAVSRFLEQATFGPTRRVVDSWDYENDLDSTFPSWVKQQIDEDATSHREYFRRRANTRIMSTVDTGEVSHPCEKNTRWSRYAFNHLDEDKILHVAGGGSGPYLFSIDGIPRTKVNDIKLRRGGRLSSPGSYKICSVNEGVSATLRLKIGGRCERLLIGNPPVNFASGTTPPNWFRLDTDADFTSLKVGARNDEFLHKNRIVDPSCDSLQSNNGVVWPVFVRFSDGNWLLNDPQLLLKTNTPSDPIIDGGAGAAADGATCANVPKTFLNIDSCRLSNEVLACGASERASSTPKRGTLVCGSPGEIGNDPRTGDGFEMKLDMGNDDNTRRLAQQKGQVWTMIALMAKDELRQKMAWALSQILAISPEAIRGSGGVEMYTNYYDIFVRNAFGNYRDILKEVSYSPMMGEMLSYRNSKSTAHNLETENVILYPDENYAREVMQLFTIGPVELNIDGTAVLDENGRQVPTYDNDDIMTFSRSWTGFERQRTRGNIEDMKNRNRIDPMNIVPAWRDIFPKLGLHDEYIGDHYPLCVDLPSRAFLRKGATYQLLGSNPHPQLQDRSHDDPTMRVVLKPGRSHLYDALCNPSVPGGSDCNFQSQVVLNEDLQCDRSGKECSIDTARVVQVSDNVFYEYVRLPCVELSFYNDAKKIVKQRRRRQTAMCANPNLSVAAEACCERRRRRRDSANRNCEYIGERMTYELATKRCEEMGRDTCSFRRITGRTNKKCNRSSEYHWTNAPCNIMLKTDNDGSVAIAHNPDGTSDSHVELRFQRTSPNFFYVNWDGDFPSPSNNCGNGLCESNGDECMCRVTVVEDVVWTQPEQVLTTAEGVLSRLSIGSLSPDRYNTRKFDDPIVKTGGIVKIFNNAGTSMNADTIIEVNMGNERKYLRNIRSTVYVQNKDGTRSDYSFRNPPHFIGFVDQDKRDAQYETDAVLEHYLYHKNTAPFLAIRFIQRFGISNPSPGYIKRVATAFINGLYQWGGTKYEFGKGEYGDLEATVAAILLDREARTVLLNEDPTYGSMKEPLLKLIGVMRSMEFKPNPKRPEVLLLGAVQKIGQMAYKIPSVFSFFHPEYAPQGPVSAASLVAPEAQLYLTPQIIGLLNGVFSMVKYGLSECYGGFGNKTPRKCKQFKEGDYGKALGELKFSPSSSNPNDIVDELSTLLTAGRLSAESRQIIEDAYIHSSDDGAGLRLAQQLILTTAEFHTTNLVQRSHEPRGDTTAPSQAPIVSEHSDSYKAIIFLMLQGGCDSYNMLVPHSECVVDSHEKDMYQEYLDVRGNVAIPKAPDLVIEANNSLQVCRKFFLHPNLSFLKILYDERDMLFLANTGILTEPVTKDDWKYKTQSMLFAHNFQQRNVQQVDPLNKSWNTGVLGRMTDVLTRNGYTAGSTSISNEAHVLVGTNGLSPAINFLDEDGADPFNQNPSSDDMMSTIKDLNNATVPTSGLFAETWSEKLYASIKQNKALNTALQSSSITETFPSTKLGKQLEMVSRMIEVHEERNKNRDVFFVSLGGFDTHSDIEDTLIEKFTEINDAIQSFVTEMKHQQKWDNVVMIEASDFGRTLTPNSKDGTDHGWGGNYFLLGGSVDGSRILGKYPDDLTSSGSQSIKRGRLIPSTSWDEVWNGVGQWFGISDAELDEVLPNRNNFENLLGRDDLFVQEAAEEKRRKYLRE